jgi:predicted transcriptional regulator YdeE
MNENRSSTAHTILPISQILPFIPVESLFQVFDMPAVRLIGKSIRDTLYSDPNPVPAFWTEFFTRGDHRVTDALPHVIPNRLAHFFDYSSETQQYTYMICVACPAGTPVPGGFEYRDAPAAFVCYGTTNENGGDPYAEGLVQEELTKLGLTLLGPFCEFYPDLEKPHFCVLFTCKPA